MKKLTNESKILFFGQNLRQPVELDNFGSKVSNRLLNGVFIDEKGFGYIKLEFGKFVHSIFLHENRFKLIKTPLQNISDEHADYLIQLEMGNWSISLYEKLIIDGNFIYFTPIFAPHSNKQEMINLNRLCFDQHKYLQSNGYALPIYCPIENRIIPVQEQIDNGWITLKTE